MATSNALGSERGLCDFCLSMFQQLPHDYKSNDNGNESVELKHHQDRASLQLSIELGCSFCQYVDQFIRSSDESLDKSSRGTPPLAEIEISFTAYGNLNTSNMLQTQY